MYHAGAGSALRPLVAVGILFAGIATMLALGIIGAAAGVPILVTLTVGEITLLALPMIVVRLHGVQRAAIGLRRAPLPLFGAAVLIGSTFWYLNLFLVSLLPFEEGKLRSLSQVVEQPPLAIALLALAVVPAVCEEVLFRGAVLRALGTRLFAPAAVVLTAVLFAGYHMSLIQLVPTFTLAILLGALAWRADSVLPAILAHFLNNAMAILVSRRQPAALAGMLEAHPQAALATCALATILGIVLIARTPA